MRMRNDMHLAEKVQDLDIILGGHDHDDEEHNLHNVYVLKSGTDFREFSVVNVRIDCSEESLKNVANARVVDFEK